MKHFLQFLEAAMYPDPAKPLPKLKEGESLPVPYESEEKFVSDFLAYLDEELVDYEERVQDMVRVLERQSYYTSHDDELNRMEKEKYEKEQKLAEEREAAKAKLPKM